MKRPHNLICGLLSAAIVAGCASNLGTSNQDVALAEEVAAVDEFGDEIDFGDYECTECVSPVDGLSPATTACAAPIEDTTQTLQKKDCTSKACCDAKNGKVEKPKRAGFLKTLCACVGIACAAFGGGKPIPDAIVNVAVAVCRAKEDNPHQGDIDALKKECKAKCVAK